MTKDILEVGSSWSLSELADYLIERSISGAPVTSDQGKLIGVVSLTDIVRHDSLAVRESQWEGPHEYYLDLSELQYIQGGVESFQVRIDSSVTVQDIMTPLIFDSKRRHAG